MKRIKALIPLSDDHHHGLVLAQLAKKNTPGFKNKPKDVTGKIASIKNAWKNELSIHFDNEEKILFPLIKGRNPALDILIHNVINDHRIIQKQIEKLEYSDEPEEDLNTFGHTLENHIRMEERELFELVQQFLSPPEIEYLEQNLTRMK